MIPQNIKSEHILKAIEEAERSGIPRERSSDRYDLEYNKELYPPKYIISLANKYANGKELDHSEFSGGDEANNFLESLGFNIVNKQNDFDEDDLEEQTHDFAPKLKDYLENIYSIKVDKGKGRAHLTFPSGAIINVRGSITLKDQRGFYHLQERDYNEILDNANRYFAVVFGGPENTFVFSREAVKTLFENVPLTYQEGKKPKWYFDIRRDNDRNYLRIHSGGGKEINIDNYLNKWDQIEDLKGEKGRQRETAYNNNTPDSDKEIQYFVLQVSRSGSEELLSKGYYEHTNWRDTPRDHQHGMVKCGDILLVYFAAQSIKYKMQLKKYIE